LTKELLPKTIVGNGLQREQRILHRAVSVRLLRSRDEKDLPNAMSRALRNWPSYRLALVEAIEGGSIALGTNLQMLMVGRIALPLSWDDHKQLFTD
jgi:hypothetical protein